MSDQEIKMKEVINNNKYKLKHWSACFIYMGGTL